jgi:hypothetical protein
VKKRSLILSLAMLAFLISAGIARATCIQKGKVARLRTGAVGNVVDIEQLNNLPAFSTFFFNPTDREYSMLAAAQAGNVTVVVYGDAASCPTTGTFRDGGNVIAVDLFRNS